MKLRSIILLLLISQITPRAESFDKKALISGILTLASVGVVYISTEKLHACESMLKETKDLIIGIKRLAENGEYDQLDRTLELLDLKVEDLPVNEKIYTKLRSKLIKIQYASVIGILLGAWFTTFLLEKKKIEKLPS